MDLLRQAQLERSCAGPPLPCQHRCNAHNERFASAKRICLQIRCAVRAPMCSPEAGFGMALTREATLRTSGDLAETRLPQVSKLSICACMASYFLSSCSSPRESCEVELGLEKTQRRGNLGARREPAEAQEWPSWASGAAPEGVLEVMSARAVKLRRSSRRRAK